MQISDTSGSNPLLNFKAERKTLSEKYFGENSIVNAILPSLPEQDRYNNLLNTRRRLLNDREYSSSVIDNYLRNTRSEEELRKLMDNPEEYSSIKNKMHTTFLNALSSEVFQGDTMGEAITRRMDQITGTSIRTPNLNQYKELIEDNHEDFQEYGILDEDGNFLLNDEMFSHEINNNQSFRQKLFDKEYESFLEVLRKSNNANVIDKANIDQMAQAFVMFDNFGPEGITQYVNAIQHADFSKSPENQENEKARQAFEFISKTTVDGKTYGDMLSEFYGSEDSEAGKFSIIEPATSIEMKKDIPKDMNPFTYLISYNAPTIEEGLSNLIERFRDTEPNLWSRMFYSYKGVDGVDGMWDIVTTLSGRRRFQAQLEGNEIPYYKAPVDSIIEDITEGYDTHLTRQALIGLVGMAERGEGITFEDIGRTILVHSEKQENGIYNFNFNELPLEAKIAVKTYSLSDDSNAIKPTREEGVYTFEPQYRNRILTGKYAQMIESGETKYIPRFDVETGELTNYEPVNDRGFISAMWGASKRFSASGVRTLAEIIDNTVNEPVYHILDNILDRDTPIYRNLAEYRENYLQEFFDVHPLQIAPDNTTWAETGGAFIGDMGAYILSFYLAGGAALPNVGRGLQAVGSGLKSVKNVKALKNANTLTQIKNTLAVQSGTKISSIGHALEKVKKGETLGTKLIRPITQIQIGEVMVTPLLTERESPLHMISFIGEFLDKEEMSNYGFDAMDTYRRSNAIAQAGVDLGITLAFTNLFDNIFAALRYSKGLAMGGRGSKIVNGEFEKLTANQFREGFKKGKFTGFSPDIYRSYRAIMDEATHIAVGDMGDAFRNLHFGRSTFGNPENTKTQADIVANFIEETDVIFDGLRGNIQNSLREYDKLFGGRVSSNINIDERADELFEYAIESLAKKLQEGMTAGSIDMSNEMLTNYTRLLREAPTRREVIRDWDNNGMVKLTRERANTIANDNLFATVVDNGDGTFSVIRTSNDFWTMRLADKLEEVSFKHSFVKSQKNYIKEHGLDINSTQKGVRDQVSELQAEFEENYGKLVNIDGKSGTVIGLTKNGAEVMGDDGVRFTVLKSRIKDVEPTTKTPKQVEIDANKKIQPPVAKLSKYKEKAKEITESKNTVKGKESIPKKPIDEKMVKYGVSESMWKVMKKAFNQERISHGVLRNIITRLGRIRGMDYRRMGNNIDQDNITLLDTNKIRKKGLPKGTIFKLKANGKEEVFIANKRIPKDYEPNLFVMNEDGSLSLDSYIRRIEPNHSFIDDIPTLYTPVEIKDASTGKFHTMYRPSIKGEKGYYINVQNPMEGKLNMKTAQEKFHDASIIESDGTRYYMLADEVNQVVDPNNINKPVTNVVQEQRVPPIKSGEKISIPEDLTSIKTDWGDGKLIYGTKEELDRYREFIKRLDSEDGLSDSELDEVSKGIADILKKSQEYEATLSKNRKAQTSQLMKHTDEGLKIVQAGVVHSHPAIGGAIMGGITDWYLSEPDENGNINITTGVMLGALAGFGYRRARNRSLLANGKEHPEVVLERAKKSDAGRSGLEFNNPFDQVEVKETNRMLNGVKAALDIGRDMREAVFSNPIVKTAYHTLWDLGGQKSREFLNGLMKIQNTVSEINSNHINRFNTKMVEHMGNNAPVNPYSSFIQEYVPTKGNEILTRIRSQLNLGDGALDEGFVRERVYESIVRALDSGYSRSSQVDNVPKNRSVFSQYRQNDFYRELDRALLDDDQFNMFITSMREAFSDVKERHLGNINTRIEVLKGEILNMDRVNGVRKAQLIDDYISSNTSKTQFRKTIGVEKDKELFDSMFKSSSSRTKLHGDMIDDLYKTMKKFTDLEGEYAPQIFSAERELKAKNMWISKMEASNRLANLSARQINDLWEEEVVERWIRANASSEKLTRVKDENGLSEGLNDLLFTSKKQAENWIKKRTAELSTEGGAHRESDTAIRLADESSIESTIHTLKDGTVSERFVINLPEDLAIGKYGVNKDVVRNYYHNAYKNFSTPESNFLERPRIASMPMEFREVDIDRMMAIYSNDVGRRIHAMEHNMFTHHEIDRYYFNSEDGMRTHLKNNGVLGDEIDTIEARVKNIHRIMYGHVGTDSKSMAQLQKHNYMSNIYRNLKFAQYGYGFGLYNLFEWASVGSNITSFSQLSNAVKLYGFGGQAGRNMEQLLDNERIFKRLIEYARPEFENLNIYDYGLKEGLGYLDNKSTKLANSIGNFSLVGTIGRVNMENKGLARLIPIFGDSFLGSSMFASAMIGRAGLGEATKLAQLGKRLKTIEPIDGVRVIKDDFGTSWSETQLRRKLFEYGVADSEYDKFVESVGSFDKLVKMMDSESNFTNQLHQYKSNPQYEYAANKLVDVVRSTVESYQGTNRMFRPEAWHTPLGKTLATYSTYATNVGFQTLQRRIRKPLQHWVKEYGENIDKNASAYAMMYHKNAGNYDKLRKMGLSNKAIEELPTDALSAVMRVASGFGISIVGYMGIDIAKDFASMFTDALAEQAGQPVEMDSSFHRDRWTIINPHAREEDQVTWNDLIERGMDFRVASAVGGAALSQFARLGTFGKFGDVIQAQQFGGLRSITQFSPLTSDADKFISTLAPNNKGLDYYKEDLPNRLKREGMNMTPIFGSSLFSQVRRDLYDHITKERPQNRNNTQTTYYGGSTNGTTGGGYY